MQTIIVLLNPGMLENADLDLRYRIPDRIEEVSNSLIQSNGYDYMMFKRRAVLDFSALPAFFVTNLLLVQCENHYFRRLMVSFNC